MMPSPFSLTVTMPLPMKYWPSFVNRDITPSSTRTGDNMADMIRTVLVEQKMIYEARIAELIKERDEARMEICSATNHPELEAEERGWDCYKENNND
jgi:hypothetical protein